MFKLFMIIIALRVPRKICEIAQSSQEKEKRP